MKTFYSRHLYDLSNWTMIYSLITYSTLIVFFLQSSNYVCSESTDTTTTITSIPSSSTIRITKRVVQKEFLRGGNKPATSVATTEATTTRSSTITQQSSTTCESTDTTTTITSIPSSSTKRITKRVLQREFLRGGNNPATSVATTEATTISIKPVFSYKTPLVMPATSNHTSTIIFLHGLGDVANGWAYSLACVRPSHMKIICPNAGIMPTEFDEDGVKELTSWFGDSKDNITYEDPATVKNATRYIHHLMNEERKSGIKSDQIFVGGFSQGGAVAIQAAFTYPWKIGGLLIMSTWIPLLKYFQKALATENQGIPIFHTHNLEDHVVPIKVGNYTSQTLSQISNKYTYLIFKEKDHDIPDEGLKEIGSFLRKYSPPPNS